MKKHFGHRLIKKAAKPLPYKPSPRREGGLRQRRSGAFVSSTNAPLFPCTTSCLSYHSHPIRPYGPPSPKGEGCDTRLPSSKKRRRSRPCESIRSPSTVIPSAAEGSLLHYRHMHTCALTQTIPWCFFSPFPHPRITGLQERSLHFGRDDVQERRVISHSLSHRCVDPSCAFGAALLQGATHIVVMTGNP